LIEDTEHDSQDTVDKTLKFLGGEFESRKSLTGRHCIMSIFRSLKEIFKI